jgi:hypothetical protein
MKTRTQKLTEAHTAYQAAKQGTKPKRQSKSGIPTYPVVPCPDLPEREVLKQCLAWLRARRVFCDRHDCGSGPGHAQYGIKGAGDIIGIMWVDYAGSIHHGVHFEIEVKRGRGGRLSKGQQERMRAVREAGGVYEVMHGVPELEHYFGGLV